LLERRWSSICYFSGNGVVWNCERAILTYVVNEEVWHRFEPPARAIPRFCRDTCIKARKASFGLTRRQGGFSEDANSIVASAPQ
jgi:hypothetical protein